MSLIFLFIPLKPSLQLLRLQLRYNTKAICITLHEKRMYQRLQRMRSKFIKRKYLEAISKYYCYTVEYSWFKCENVIVCGSTINFIICSWENLLQGKLFNWIERKKNVVHLKLIVMRRRDTEKCAAFINWYESIVTLCVCLLCIASERASHWNFTGIMSTDSSSGIDYYFRKRLKNRKDTLQFLVHQSNQE